jgi:hypothetical protein
MRAPLLAAAVTALALACGAIAAASPEQGIGFELPYDLAVAADGTIYFPDRSRVLALDPRSGRVRLHAKIAGARELVGLTRLANGTIFVTDLPSGRVLRVRRGRPASVVATVPDPVDLVADQTGATLWVASIADGVGLVRVDVKSGDVEPFASVEKPHGLDHDAKGDFVVHDGHAVSRVDGTTGAVTPLAQVDAFKLVVAPDGSVYGAVGGPKGGRVVRIARNGRVTVVAGTGRLGRDRDGPALRAPMLPSAVELGKEGSLLVAQIEPVPSIRRVDVATGRITTLARGR